MEEIRGYKELIELGSPDFIEIKGVTYCGSSGASDLTMKNVPYHKDVCEFGEELCRQTEGIFLFSHMKFLLETGSFVYFYASVYLWSPVAFPRAGFIFADKRNILDLDNSCPIASHQIVMLELHQFLTLV